MSTLFSAMKPVLLTRLLQETPIGESLAGAIVAAPFAGIAVSSLLFYLRPPRATVRTLGLLFGTLLVALQWGSAQLLQHVLPLLLMLATTT